MIKQLNYDLAKNGAFFKIDEYKRIKGVPQYMITIRRVCLPTTETHKFVKQLQALTKIVDDYNNRLLGLKKFVAKNKYGEGSYELWFKSKKQAYYFNPGLTMIEEAK